MANAKTYSLTYRLNGEFHQHIGHLSMIVAVLKFAEKQGASRISFHEV
ncbi:MAG: hypothetical protein [Chaetfec virus UA24_2292]|nr:MAG: hypothetical protein [Chaetfec virus UA24_2292]